ncbi:MAG: O-antigen ligase family protein [Candidatus Omnitrophica bacterium]|nr:O-antigen ligase family protein [Candidatus Omnitrophota bacterium]
MEQPLYSLVIIFVLCAGLLIGFFTATAPPTFLLLTILAFFVSVISFFRPDLGIYILIVSLFFAPDIRTGGTAAVYGDMAARQVKFRPEDFLIMFIAIGWFFKMATQKDVSFIRTPLAAPIMVFCAVMLISAALGVAQNYVTVKRAFLFLVKKVEYFLLYFMVVNNIRTREGFRLGLIIILLSSAAVALVGLIQYRIVGYSYFSITSTFGLGQANILGGFLLIVIPLTWALYLISKKGLLRLTFLGLFGVCLASLLLTKSRGAYVGLAVAVATFVYLSRKGWLLPAFLALVCIFIFFAPLPVREELGTIFHSTVPRDFSAIERMSSQTDLERTIQWGTILQKTGLDSSWAARIAASMSVWPRIKKNFIFGQGMGAVELAYVDNEYVYDLVSVGIVGFLAFLWLLYRIGKMVHRLLLESAEDPLLRALCMGFLSSLMGLLVQGMTITNFYTIRTMTPFWFLLGLIVVEASLMFGKLEQRENAP